MARRRVPSEREREKMEALRCPYCGSLVCKCRLTPDDFYEDDEYE